MKLKTSSPRIESRPLTWGDFDSRTEGEECDDRRRHSDACVQFRVKDAVPVRELDEIGQGIYQLLARVERWVRRYPFTMPEKKAERLNLAIDFQKFELYRTLEFLTNTLRAFGDQMTDSFWPPAFPLTYRLLVKEGRQELDAMLALKAAQESPRPPALAVA